MKSSVAHSALALLMIAATAHCGPSDTPHDAAIDAAPADAGADAGTRDDGTDITITDSGMDATMDAVADGGTDAPIVADSTVDADSGTDSSTPTCAPDAGTVMAIRRLAFGEGSSGEWRAYGFDLDGRASTAASTDVCQPNSGASPSVPYPDGNDGIDNSFGKNILPTILSIYPSFVADANNNITNGAFTDLLDLGCLPPTGDVATLASRVSAASLVGTTPIWDGTDAWRVRPEWLTNPVDPTSSLLVFPNGSVTGNVFDSGPNGSVVLNIPMAANGTTVEFRLTIRAARLRMTLSADRGSATGGIIGGVLDTEELVGEVRKLGAALALCGTPIIDSLSTQIRQASDIMADGTQDPTRTCSGISIGLGFEMQAAHIGAVGDAVTPAPGCP